MLHDIYDKDKDDAEKGKCCQRVQYYVYTKPVCKGPQCKFEEKRRRLFPPTANMLDQDFNLANHCLEIFIYEQVVWKICNRLEDKILKLKQTILFGVLKTIAGVNKNQMTSIIH